MKKNYFLLIIMIILISSSQVEGYYDDNNDLDLNYLKGDKSTLSTDIYEIYVNADNQFDNFKELNLSEWGTIDYISPTPFTVFSLYINVTGLMQRDFGTIYYNETSVSLGNSTVFGQMYAILDDTINTVPITSLSDLGMLVTIPYGDHTFSFIYLIMDEFNEIHYASDTVTFRIRESGEVTSFEPYKSRSIPLNLDLDDVYVDKEISGKAISLVSNPDTSPNGIYSRDFVFHPDVNSKIKFNETEVKYNDLLEVDDNEPLIFDLEVSTNSTGFNDFQIKNKWNSTKGINFLLDATGLHEINSDLDSISIRNGDNYVGLLTLAPYGLWHSLIPHPLGWTNNNPDWDSGVVYIENGSNIVFIDAAYDFIFGIDGEHFRAFIGTRSTITNTDQANFRILWGIPLCIAYRRIKK